MREIKIVFMKELKRIFSDKKLVFSLFILPVIMVLGIMALMITLVNGVIEKQDAHIATVGVYQMPQSFQQFLNETEWEGKYELKEIGDLQSLADAKNEIYNKELDIILAFDAEFDVQIEAYQVGKNIPNIQVYYNPSSDFSSDAREMVLSNMLEPYRMDLISMRYGSDDVAKIFSLDAAEESPIIQDQEKANGELLGTIIPYIVTVLLFAGAMSVGIDMIVGEKERGTMATLLITPVKRTNIVMGKILAMMALTSISAVIYAASIIAGMPFLLFNVMGSESGREVMKEASQELAQTEDIMGLAIHFQPWQVWMLILLLIAMVYVYVAMIALVAVFAKDLKEGSTYIMPLFTVVMLSGMVTMFAGENAGTGSYCIPLYGAVMAMKNILAQNISAFNCGVTLVSHILLGTIIIIITAKTFSNEKVMFNA